MQVLLSLKGICKNFGGIKALQNVDFDVNSGEVHALVGENGAGKSTLMKVIAGNHQPDGGTIEFDGKKVIFKKPYDALRQKIVLIHQETALANDLTVAENIMMYDLPALINWKKLKDKSQKILDDLGFKINPYAQVRELSAAQKQIVEIAKALSLDARILVLDEPTASLAPTDAERLLSIVSSLRERGVGIVYISHRLDEIFTISNRITVLKDGQHHSTIKPAETNMDDLIQRMVGRPLAALYPRRQGIVFGDTVLDVQGFSRKGIISDASFSVRAGEVVGIGGLIGSGRTELMRMVFGVDKRDKGKIFVDGKEKNIRSAIAGVRAGIGLVPEDRKGQGVILNMPIRMNSTMARLSDVTNHFRIFLRRKERRTVNSLIKSLRIKTKCMEDNVSTLSGGNQQKVVLAKWFHSGGRVLILDEPTRGVDVGAKTEIYNLINKMAEDGKAVIVVSSDHQELIGISDRIIVMGDGKIKGELAPSEFSEKNIVSMSFGMVY